MGFQTIGLYYRIDHNITYFNGVYEGVVVIPFEFLIISYLFKIVYLKDKKLHHLKIGTCIIEMHSKT